MGVRDRPGWSCGMLSGAGVSRHAGAILESPTALGVSRMATASAGVRADKKDQLVNSVNR